MDFVSFGQPISNGRLSCDVRSQCFQTLITNSNAPCPDRLPTTNSPISDSEAARSSQPTSASSLAFPVRSPLHHPTSIPPHTRAYASLSREASAIYIPAQIRPHSRSISLIPLTSLNLLLTTTNLTPAPPKTNKFYNSPSICAPLEPPNSRRR